MTTCHAMLANLGIKSVADATFAVESGLLDRDMLLEAGILPVPASKFIKAVHEVCAALGLRLSTN